jgi:hypothetical protein
MRTSFKLCCVVLLLVLGISVGLGWGSLTHVYFANHLGVRYGPLNQNEIYGAVLPDLFGYDFTTQGFTADYAFHASAQVYWGLYALAASPMAKAAFYGVFTHNNIDGNVRGADWYAHGVYPIPNQGNPDPSGWVIDQGGKLVGNPVIGKYLIDLLGPYTPYFMPVVGHTLVETAVDILVRRHQDPLAGARLLLAARDRSNDIPQVLAAVFGNSTVPDFPKAQDVITAEAAYRQQMMGYGQLFLLPESRLITEISKQTIVVAQMFLTQVLGIPPDQVPEFDPNKIAEFIRIAIRQVEPVYREELMATMCNVEKNMKNGPPPAGPVFAFWRDGVVEDDLAEFKTQTNYPTEFALDQNFPNPFNPTTNIAYAIPSDSRVTLKVYSSLGQEIATLVDENMTAGRYVATWNANGIASGTYFYRMQAGSTVLTKKMMVLR